MEFNIWISIVLLLQSLGVNGFINKFLSSPGNITKCVGDDVLFSWTYPPSHSVVNIEWKKENVRMSVQNILGNEQPTITSLYAGRLFHGKNADVTLKNLTISDTGSYSCLVLYTDGNTVSDTSYLTIYGELPVPTIGATFNRNFTFTLRSNITDFGIKYTWTHNGMNISRSSSVIASNNGNYSLCLTWERSTCTTLSGSKCVHYTVSGIVSPTEAPQPTKKEGTITGGAIAGIVVGVTLVLILVIFIVVCLLRNR